jgi:hypothetical protein
MLRVSLADRAKTGNSKALADLSRIFESDIAVASTESEARRQFNHADDGELASEMSESFKRRFILTIPGSYKATSKDGAFQCPLSRAFHWYAGIACHAQGNSSSFDVVEWIVAVVT